MSDSVMLDTEVGGGVKVEGGIIREVATELPVEVPPEVNSVQCSVEDVKNENVVNQVESGPPLQVVDHGVDNPSHPHDHMALVHAQAPHPHPHAHTHTHAHVPQQQQQQHHLSQQQVSPTAPQIGAIGSSDLGPHESVIQPSAHDVGVPHVVVDAAVEAAVAHAVNSEFGEEDEPARKKFKMSSAKERNKYKGMRIRQCLCGRPECLPRLKGWIDLDDSRRQGFKELPRQSSKTTPIGLEKNRIRDVMFLHIKGEKAPRYSEEDKTNRERKLFVAYHHFHPLLLQDGNKGPIPYVTLELAERIGGFHERDAVKNLPGVVFHPIPHYPRHLADQDFEQAGGIDHVRYSRPRKEMSQEAQSKNNKIRKVLAEMERDPLKLAADYLDIQDRLERLEKSLHPSTTAAVTPTSTLLPMPSESLERPLISGAPGSTDGQRTFMEGEVVGL